MIEFWSASIALMLTTALLIAWPLLKKKKSEDELLRDELNKALYKDRLAELESEQQAGLVNEQSDLIADLKQSLLNDVPNPQRTGSKHSKGALAWIVISVLFTAVTSYGVYSWMGGIKQVESWHEVSSRLPELSKKLMGPEDVTLSDKDMEELTLALRTRLHHNPDDATGWLLLGRISLASRDVEMAIGAMKNAHRLASDNSQVQFGYAQALMMSQDSFNMRQAKDLLDTLVANGYGNLRVRSLLALEAYERKDYLAAIKQWQLMQSMVGEQDQRYAMLTDSIAEARSQMGELPIDSGLVDIVVSLKVPLPTSEQSSLIVSIHTADGAPMPVAAKRFGTQQFPLTLSIDDSNAMLEGRRISDLPEFIVRARLDYDGNVATKQGDWFGESEVVKLGETVRVNIDTQY